MGWVEHTCILLSVFWYQILSVSGEMCKKRFNVAVTDKITSLLQSHRRFPHECWRMSLLRSSNVCNNFREHTSTSRWLFVCLIWGALELLVFFFGFVFFCFNKGSLVRDKMAAKKDLLGSKYFFVDVSLPGLDKHSITFRADPFGMNLFRVLINIILNQTKSFFLIKFCQTVLLDSPLSQSP